ncbi:MAG: hypothetical protein P8X82_03650 [Gemmatimonadales bacterium]
MKHGTALITLILAAAGPARPVLAQEPDVRAELVARGAPNEFAEQVAAIVSSASNESLPTEPLVAKALEGWAKRGRVPPDRVIAVLNQMTSRLRIGRDITANAGLDPAPASVVAAAADALGRGINEDQVGDLIRSAPGPDAAATGLTVAASLAAQGLEMDAAVRVIGDALRGGRTTDEMLEYPSALMGARARGERIDEMSRRIMEGGGLPPLTAPGMGGQSGRPQSVPGGSGQKKKGKGQSGLK